jgi:RNA recognition motif-containing protein
MTRSVRNRNRRGEDGQENTEEPPFVRLSLGYGFVTYATAAGANKAVAALNEKVRLLQWVDMGAHLTQDLGGRPLNVQLARPPTEKPAKAAAVEGGEEKPARRPRRRTTAADDVEETTATLGALSVADGTEVFPRHYTRTYASAEGPASPACAKEGKARRPGGTQQDDGLYRQLAL